MNMKINISDADRVLKKYNHELPPYAITLIGEIKKKISNYKELKSKDSNALELSQIESEIDKKVIELRLFLSKNAPIDYSDRVYKGWYDNLSIENLKKISKFISEIEQQGELLYSTDSNIHVITNESNRDVIKFLWAHLIPTFPDAILSSNITSIPPKSELFFALIEVKEYIEKKIQEIENSTKNIPDQSQTFLNAKLVYYPEDSMIEYKGELCNVSNKSKAILDFLFQSKNTPFDIDELKLKCNTNILNPDHFIKTHKDIRDSISYIKFKLKVKKNEYFPIVRRGNSWIWIEK